MNTPEPCDTCKNLYYNCLFKDDESYMAECKLEKEMGGKECPDYLPIRRRHEDEAVERL